MLKAPAGGYDIGGFRFEDEIRFDPTTLTKLRQLQVQKRDAVLKEDFKRAKEVQDLMEKLKVEGEHVAELIRERDTLFSKN